MCGGPVSQTEHSHVLTTTGTSDTRAGGHSLTCTTISKGRLRTLAGRHHRMSPPSMPSLNNFTIWNKHRRDLNPSVETNTGQNSLIWDLQTLDGAMEKHFSDRTEAKDPQNKEPIGTQTWGHGCHPNVVWGSNTGQNNPTKEFLDLSDLKERKISFYKGPCSRYCTLAFSQGSLQPPPKASDTPAQPRLNEEPTALCRARQEF